MTSQTWRPVGTCALHVGRVFLCAGVILLAAAPAQCENYNAWRWGGGSASSATATPALRQSVISSLSYPVLAKTASDSNAGKGTLSGYVYVDADADDGPMDNVDWAIEDVAISLLRDGTTTPMIVYTQQDGSYRFADLSPGTYTVTMLTPCSKPGTATAGQIADSKGDVDAASTAAVVVATKQNQFSNIVLTTGSTGINFNFADMVYPIGAISKRMLINSDPGILHTVPEPGTLALLAAAGLVLGGLSLRRRRGIG